MHNQLSKSKFKPIGQNKFLVSVLKTAFSANLKNQIQLKKKVSFTTTDGDLIDKDRKLMTKSANFNPNFKEKEESKIAQSMLETGRNSINLMDFNHFYETFMDFYSNADCLNLRDNLEANQNKNITIMEPREADNSSDGKFFFSKSLKFIPRNILLKTFLIGRE